MPPEHAHRPLTAADLLPRGPLRRVGGRTWCFEQLDSTNRFLLDQAHEAPDGAVAWAEQQTAGRGRLGRAWLAPRGSSLLVSVLLIERDDSPLARYAGLVGALAALEAVELESDCRPALRWPNDLVLEGRKLGGVLAEARPLPGGRRAVVLGIGVNCLQHAGHFPPELQTKATSLELGSPAPIDRARLAACLLERLDYHVAPDTGDPQAWRVLWRQRCADVGARTRLQSNGQVHDGTVLEIDQDGDLVVQTDGGVRMRFESATTTRLWE